MWDAKRSPTEGVALRQPLKKLMVSTISSGIGRNGAFQQGPTESMITPPGGSLRC